MDTQIKKQKDFDTVAFFRAIKEKMAKATENMTLEEERHYWKMLRDGKIKLDVS
jgi:hypothetical protein